MYMCTWSKRSVVRGHNVSLDALCRTLQNDLQTLMRGVCSDGTKPFRRENQVGALVYTCTRTCKIYNASPNVLHKMKMV